MAVTHPSPMTALRESMNELPVLPHVIFAILEPAGQESLSLTKLEQIVSVDPGFAAKVLVLANSGLFGLEVSKASVHGAIDVLGYRSVRTLAMTAGAFEMFAGKNDPESLRRRRWWRSCPS